MKTMRQLVLSKPLDKQLEYALYLLDELSGAPEVKSAWLRRIWNLTPMQCKILCALNAAHPHIVTKEGLFASLATDAEELKMVDVYIHKIRKNAPYKIETVWGVGYRLSEKIEIPEEEAVGFFERENRSIRWTKEQDDDLVTMLENGSKLSAIAYEMGRTERAVMERIKLKGHSYA